MAKVLTKVEPPIGWLIFNRPEVLNAFDVEMWRKVPEAALELDENNDVEIIIMRGEGNVFGAGADIKELLEYTKKGIAQEYADAVNYCFSGLAKVRKVIIAAVERYALGGGCMVALSCDLRVAGQGAKIGIPLVKLGLAVEPLGIKRLMEIAGSGFAAEFLLTGDVIPMDKLINSGVVNFVVPDEKVVEFSKELALRLLKNGKYALRTTKRIMKEFVSGKPDYDFLHTAFASCMNTEEFVQRAEGFINKS